MNVLHKHKTTALDEFQSDFLFTQLILSCKYVAVYHLCAIRVSSREVATLFMYINVSFFVSRSKALPGDEILLLTWLLSVKVAVCCIEKRSFSCLLL